MVLPNVGTAERHKRDFGEGREVRVNGAWTIVVIRLASAACAGMIAG
jgi:hypothetical protein